MNQRNRPIYERPRFIVILVAMLIVVGWSVRALSHHVNGYRYYSIPTSSMAPTIAPGDNIQVELRKPQQEPQRCEIWAIELPGAAPGTIAIKRIIGLPGETISVSGGQVMINGKPLKEPYLKIRPGYTMTPQKLMPDEYFLLGDNRNGSNDSHVWGPLKADRLVGRVRMRYWPPKRVGGL